MEGPKEAIGFSWIDCHGSIPNDMRGLVGNLGRGRIHTYLLHRCTFIESAGLNVYVVSMRVWSHGHRIIVIIKVV